MRQREKQAEHNKKLRSERAGELLRILKIELLQTNVCISDFCRRHNAGRTTIRNYMLELKEAEIADCKEMVTCGNIKFMGWHCIDHAALEAYEPSIKISITKVARVVNKIDDVELFRLWGIEVRDIPIVGRIHLIKKKADDEEETL